MIAEVLVSTIIQFCSLNSLEDLNSNTKSACMDYMVNCSVDTKGGTAEERVQTCARTWRSNTEALIKEMNKKQEEE